MKGCIAALDTGYRDLVNERANYRGRYDFFVPNDDPKLTELRVISRTSAAPSTPSMAGTG